MQIYLLDTNALSELVRNPNGPVATTYRIKARDPESEVLTSIVVACEIRYGLAKNYSAALERRIHETLSRIKVESFALGADDTYGTIRTELERKGLIIGQNDLLIAAHALALGAILITDNTREFKRVKGLRLENWLRG